MEDKICNMIDIHGYTKNNNNILPTTLLERHKNCIKEYLDQCNIKIEKGQMFLYGRALCDIEINDVLISKKNSKMYIKKFTPILGLDMGYLPEIYTGGIICNVVDDEFCRYEKIHVLKNGVAENS